MPPLPPATDPFLTMLSGFIGAGAEEVRASAGRCGGVGGAGRIELGARRVRTLSRPPRCGSNEAFLEVRFLEMARLGRARKPITAHRSHVRCEADGHVMVLL